MDVTKHLSPWLTLDVLRTRFNDVYEGTVTAVVEEELRHPKTYQRYIGLVLVFDDGRRYGPAKTALRAIVGWWGTESDAWVGRTIQIVRKRIERTSKKTGEVTVRYERVVACPDPHARDFRADTETDESLTDTDIPWSGKPTVRARRLDRPGETDWVSRRLAAPSSRPRAAGAADYSETRKGPLTLLPQPGGYYTFAGTGTVRPVLSGEIRKVWRPWRDSNPRYPP